MNNRSSSNKEEKSVRRMSQRVAPHRQAMEFPWNKTECANVDNDLTATFRRAAHNDDQKLQFHIPCSFIVRNQYLLDKKGGSSPWHPPYAHLFHLLIRYYYLYHAIWASVLFCSKELLCTGRNEQFNIFRELFSMLNNVLHNSQSQAKPRHYVYPLCHRFSWSAASRSKVNA